MKDITTNVKKKLLDYYEQGVPVSQIHGCMAIDRNRIVNMLLTVKDLQHEVYKERRLKMVSGDAVAMMEYFEKMQSDNQIFFHAQRLDEEGRLKDVLWVDARSRVAYEDFGNVVCFDATYLTNEYELPFVNFVGVNHHGQSLLLGCALVSHEDCDTFAWIFRQWLTCMNNRAPNAILTDQAAAMRRPLAEFMPNTMHRWCIWHIMSKIPEKLGKCARYQEFKNPLKEVVYESLTPEEFQERWAALISEYKLGDNKWLESLHKESHMWVPAYMKEFSWAGMKTTQRVESINQFFDGFVNHNTKLFEFPQKYCIALGKRVRDEVSADQRCSKYLRRLVSGFKVEKFFQKIYTDSKFQEVQTECSRMMYCNVREEKVLSENLIQYKVEDRVWIVLSGTSEEIITDRRRVYTVTFCSSTSVVECDCRKFETHGILCKHSIRILDQNLVFDIPEKYILPRWRKDIPRKHTRVKVAYHDPGETEHVMRFNKMMAKFEPLCETAAMVNDQTMEMVIETLSKLTKAINEAMVKKGEEKIPVISGGSRDINTVSSTGEGRTNSSVQNGTAEIPDEEDPNSPVNDFSVPIATLFPVKDPIIKKRHPGRPKVSRHKTLAETGYKKSNKKDNLCRDINAVVAPPGKAVKGKAVKGKGKTATTAMASTSEGKATTSTAKGKANVSQEKGNMSKEKATKAKTKPPVKRKWLDELDA